MRLALALTLVPSLVTAMLACGEKPPVVARPGPSSAVSSDFERVVSGTSPSLAGARATHVFTDAASFDAWLASMSPTKPATPVDFATRVVLAVDGEDGSNGCHAVRILHVTRGADGLAVDVARYEPGPQQACTMMMVRPYDAVSVARPTGEPKATFAWTRVTGSPAP